MKNVLLVTSSPRGEASYSTQIATDLARDLGGNLTVRELWRQPLQPIDSSFVHAMFTPEDSRTPEQRAALTLSDELIREVREADVLVIAAGLINFGMPAALKIWIDLITRAGVTFKYGESGPEGLVRGKRAILVLAAGGVYSSGPMAAKNHLEPPLRTNLDFLGIEDIETVWVEGVAFGAEAVEQALADAKKRSQELLARAS